MTQPSRDESDAPSPEELRERVEQTRHELGMTIEALAAKAVVKARAQEKATEVTKQAAQKAEELKAEASQTAARIQDRTPDPVKDKAAVAAEQIRAKAAQATDLLQEKAPEPVRQKAAEGVRMARENRTLLLTAAGVVVLVWLAARRSKE
ncbi:hypothetical protein C6N75_17725 [Streptomyces solincola]|uniref:DUF3618 domain-containing protein n=1 Tax=Streptomyces solincola TaxID=2100817 RepID=A0A2S9PTY6_9ACTN|nr:DUF3618 domain-containing protein [Streptomyces solincola]PRH77865.1 hypothetical protein C6N75_17725 [Streptomyces solincola]